MCLWATSTAPLPRSMSRVRDVHGSWNLAMPAGASWFLCLDAVDNPTTTCVYGYLTEGVAVLLQAGPYSNVPIIFSESLG